jgi:hypothetical protein
VIGAQPQWLDDAGAHNNPNSVPYVVATPPIAAGFIFGYPLTAGRTNPNNKILWVVGQPRNSSNLELRVHPVNATQPVVVDSIKPDSGPGQIYPSILDMPQSGCWHFELRWAGHEATVDLRYA